MIVTEQVYQISGVAYGTNSNTFLIDTEKGWVLIDAGFGEFQLGVMRKNLEALKVDFRDIRQVLLTHAHFDHAGNARFFQNLGIEVSIGENDRSTVEQGGLSTLEPLFYKKFPRCEAVRGLRDGETLDFGDVAIQIIGTPGHTKGAVAYLVKASGTQILFTGDLFVISGVTPQEEVLVELGWNGDPLYDKEADKETFARLRGMDVDVIAPGHGTVYYGDSREIFEKLYRFSKES